MILKMLPTLGRRIARISTKIRNNKEERERRLREQEDSKDVTCSFDKVEFRSHGLGYCPKLSHPPA